MDITAFIERERENGASIIHTFLEVP